MLVRTLNTHTHTHTHWTRKKIHKISYATHKFPAYIASGAIQLSAREPIIRSTSLFYLFSLTEPNENREGKKLRPDTHKTWMEKKFWCEFPQFCRSNFTSGFYGTRTHKHTTVREREWERERDVYIYFFIFMGWGCVMCKNHCQSQCNAAYASTHKQTHTPTRVNCVVISIAIYTRSGSWLA